MSIRTPLTAYHIYHKNLKENPSTFITFMCIQNLAAWVENSVGSY